MHTYFHLE